MQTHGEEDGADEPWVAPRRHRHQRLVFRDAGGVVWLHVAGVVAYGCMWLVWWIVVACGGRWVVCVTF